MAAALIENVAVRDIERDLGRLRDELTAPGQPLKLRTSAMTHIAWVPERWVEAATETLRGLEERHPSRSILLLPKPDEPRDALDAEVTVRCFRGKGEEREICCEVVAIRLCGRRAGAPASVVVPFLVSDVPVFLRWRGPVPFGQGELDQLLELADRLVVDSAEWGEPARDYRRLPELFPRVAVSDIAWARTQRWREAVAALWPGVAQASVLRVAGPEAEALLLAGWLRGRLGRDVRLEREPAGETELVEVDGLPAVPERPAERVSPSDLLSDQLDVFGRDPIYEEAVRSSSTAPT